MYIFQKHIWLLPPNEALVLAKREIDHAPSVNEDPDLYAPIFRNISVFKRYLDFFLLCRLIHLLVTQLCHELLMLSIDLSEFLKMIE